MIFYVFELAACITSIQHDICCLTVLYYVYGEQRFLDHVGYIIRGYMIYDDIHKLN